MTDFASGLALMIAAVFFAVRQILLNPKTDGWPPAPTLVRVSLFVFMLGCAFQGVSLMGLSFTAQAGRVSAAGAALCWSIAFYSVSMTINVAVQYYPKAVWDRVERILTLASCKNATVIIELWRSGFKVFIPGRNDPTPISAEDIVDPRL